MADTTVKIKGDASDLIAAIRQAEAALGRIKTAADSATNSLGGISTQAKQINNSLGLIRLDSLINLAARALGAAQGIASLADASTNINNKIKSVTNTNAEAAQAFQDVADIALKTGSNMEGVADLFQKVQLAGKNMGISLNDARIVTENFAKTLKVTGTSGPAATSAIYQFGQALGRGVVAFEDMKQIQEASGATLDLIAKQFGKTTQQFLKDVQAQRVGSIDLINALKQIGQDVDPLFEKMGFTIGQSMENIRTSFIVTLGKIESKYGVFTKLAEIINNLSNNLDTVVPLVAAFGAAWAAMKIAGIVEGLIAVAVALRTVGTTAAVASALATGGLTAIAAVAGGTAAYLAATKMFEDLDKDENVKKATKDIEDLEKQAKKTGKVLKYQGPILDVKSIREAADIYLRTVQFQEQIAGIGRQRQEQEQAIFQFAQQQKITYEQAAENSGKEIRNAVARKQLAEAEAGIKEQMLTLSKEIEILGAYGLVRQQQLSAVEQIRRQYGQEIADKYREQVENAVKLKVIVQETVNLNRELAAAQEDAVEYYNNMKKENLVMLDTRLKILEIERKIGEPLDENTKKVIAHTDAYRNQLALLKQIRGNMESFMGIPNALGAQAEVSGRIGQLDPVTQALRNQRVTMDGLKALRDEGWIGEQQYQRARINAEVEANEAIMAARSKMFENTKLLELQGQKNSIFGYEQQKQIAAESAKFEMQSTYEKTKFGIDQAQTVFAALGAQNKKAFEASKALAVASAVMNTYQGATKALATYPWPFGLIAAAAAVAAGFAQVNAIKSQQYSGKMVGGAVAGAGSYIVGEKGPELFTPGVTGNITPNHQMGGGSTNVNFTIVANDTAGFDELLTSRRGVITQIISDAMLERGQRM